MANIFKKRLYDKTITTKKIYQNQKKSQKYLVQLIKLFSPSRDFHLVLRIINPKMFVNANDVV